MNWRKAYAGFMVPSSKPENYAIISHNQLKEVLINQAGGSTMGRNQGRRIEGESIQELNEYYKGHNEFMGKFVEPPPPLPHDEPSLNVFIDWLLQPPRFRIFAYNL